MDEINGAPLASLPGDMFKLLLQHTAASEGAARLGLMSFRSTTTTLKTPNYIVPTSRGAIPHLTQDNVQKHTKIAAVYHSLEDFIEKSPTDAPIYSTPVQTGESRLRRYTCLPDKCVSLLGPRRVPSIECPASNTNSAIAISTSVGFRWLELEQYNEAIKKLGADVSMTLADVIPTKSPGFKRLEKSADRTHAWLRDTIEGRSEDDSRSDPLPPIFASIPPLEPERLSFLLSDLHDDYRSHISGLCTYSLSTFVSLPEDLRQLPSICLDDPPTPQAVLAAVQAGVDLLTVPFVTRASEQGIALSFSFPDSKAASETLDKPLGVDMWSTEHATDLSPLSPGCECYACEHHHRAYVHHLLQASEMLAWTLLQIHNYSVIDSFFTNVRHSIEQGTLENDTTTFSREYQSELPKQTGKGPRVRGYQMKSQGRGEPKKNPKAYGRLDDQLQKLAEAESGVATPDGNAEDIEEHGLAQKVPQ
ncbi:Queuine tRNA-ribosyltransferase accessory subunit 2 [Exophiala dermatitidis]|uniref:Queuine tRNA-ribosyltransferase accessory subunit 2 n=1 Tax=Exophiala dermatitidis (strain ATCC 34100 / CBS 525.76 / NIH/UT8656) TaxID=858893 RepID=H6BSH4_EXODN|nr:queuine tRNA-ribosyltransferase [Exophiala dermatitidis NIH/UT8656]EHY54182.1 queuine tRNA-ribosyltransferase [Exophiala dermatitidis NIH/UT8656]